MSQENVDLLYRSYEAFRDHDNEACVRDSAADVEIVSYLLEVEGTVYKGHAGLRRYIDQVFAVFPDWHARVVRTIEHFRDGKLAGFTAYGDRAEALEAVRRSE